MTASELAAVHAVLDDAEAIAKRHFRRVKPQWKPSQSYVTEADFAVQDRIISWLKADYPEDGLIAEERSLRRAPARGSRTWIIDPIDGTASFVRGFPTWGIGLALVEDYEPLAGFFTCPVTNERFWAIRRQGAFRNGQQLSVRKPSPLGRETILLAFSRFHRTSRLKVEFPGKVRSLGSTIAHAAYAAAGSCDVALLARSLIWDLAPGLILMREAGGVMRYLYGSEVSLGHIWDGQPTDHFVLCGHPDTLAAIEQEGFIRR